MNHWISDSATTGHSNALRIALAFASAGLAPPAVGLACHLGGAEALEIEPGTPAQERAIAAFCGRDDLPDFEAITLHCPWSCLSPGVQAVVTDFVRRKLRAGGVFAVSYHCQPGWAPMAPVRSLLAQTASAMTGPGADSSSIDNGMIARTLDFTDRLLRTKPAYFDTHPGAGARLRSLREQPGAALVRDYFSPWQPLSFANLAAMLGAARLTFACPVDYLDHIADRHLTGPQQALLAELADTVFAESVRDIMVNRSMRADYWVKGARPLSPLQQLEAKRRPVVVLAARPAELDQLDEAKNEETTEATSEPTRQALQAPMLALMADHQPRTIGTLAAALQSPQVALQQVFEAVLVLVASGRLKLESV